MSETSPIKTDFSSYNIAMLAGASAMAVGTFMPIVHLPIIGTINYIAGGRGDGIIIFAVATLVAALVVLRQRRFAVVAAFVAIVVMLSTIIQLLERLAKARASAPNGLAAMFAQAIGLEWGWVILMGGAFVVVGAGIMAPRESPAVISKKEDNHDFRNPDEIVSHYLQMKGETNSAAQAPGKLAHSFGRRAALSPSVGEAKSSRSIVGYFGVVFIVGIAATMGAKEYFRRGGANEAIPIQSVARVNAPIASASAHNAPVTDCDRLAANPSDPQRKAADFAVDKINSTAAIPSCEAALREYSNDARLTYQLGRSYFAAKNYPAAMDQFRIAADQGYAAALYNVGGMYQNGWGVDIDDAQAVVWYRKATEQGNSMAQFQLGKMYENGRGVGIDETQAIVWYRKAAEQGNQYAAKAQQSINTRQANAEIHLNNFNCRSQYGYVITEGEVTNISNSPIRHLEIIASIYSSDGSFMRSDSALVTYDPVMPGQTTPFKAIGPYNPMISTCKVAFKRFSGAVVGGDNHVKERYLSK
jgi:tetratricopeptide (TPR) repeat protein